MESEPTIDAKRVRIARSLRRILELTGPSVVATVSITQESTCAQTVSIMRERWEQIRWEVVPEMEGHTDELPAELTVRAECERIEYESDTVMIYECSDEVVGCDVEEWYPELEIGYYIVDAEFGEVLDHATELSTAIGYVVGYEKGRPERMPIPLFSRKHTPQLAETREELRVDYSTLGGSGE